MTEDQERRQTEKIRAAGYSPDGGPAFPQHVFTPMHPGGGQWTTVGGMTLRDYIAAQTAATIAGGFVAAQFSTSAEDTIRVAKAAYTLADAMLAAREAAQ